MTRSFGSAVLPSLVTVALLGPAGCAINPATGKHQLALIGESQEIAIGRENDKAISAQLGLYPDEALQQYVTRLGRSLAAVSERPDLEWTFRVVDDPVVNAFALPGGYIYITRGILAHLGSEAELASVLGHEIGHVTARHSVNQMSKAQLAQIGLVGASVAAPEAMGGALGSLAETGLGLMFLKFGRDDERQADDLGLRYLIADGYDPHPMPLVFDTLRRVSEAQGAGRVPGWMSTHPLPENREQRIAQQIAASGRSFAGAPIREQEFLAAIEGIVFGDDPRQGYFDERTFFHPEMEFRFDFPSGFELTNRRDSVTGVSEAQDALIRIGLAAETTPAAALDKFLSQDGINRSQPWSGGTGLTASGAEFSAATSDGGTLRGLVQCVAHQGRVFVLLGFAPETKWSAYEAAARRSLSSFARLTDRRALTVEPRRLHAVRLTESMDLATFARRHAATVPEETLALINRLEPGQRLVAGRSYKVVRGGRVP